MGGLVDAIGEGFEAVGDFIGDAADWVVDFVGDSLKSIETTIKNIVKDPLPTILMIAGQAVGIPPYVTSAVITAARGGDLEDVAKSAAVAYITQEAMSATGVGQDISSFTKELGFDVTDSMINDFNLSPEVASAIGRATTASVNSAIIGGIRAGLTGQDISEGITSGFIQGAIYSGTDSYFDEVNKDPNWGFSKETLGYIKGSTSSALNAIATGNDPATAVGNYVVYATSKMASSEIATQAKQYYKDFVKASENIEKSQDSYEKLKDTYDQKVMDYETLRAKTQPFIDEYNVILKDQYTPFKAEYEKQGAALQGTIDAYNNYVAEFQRYKDLYDSADKPLRDARGNIIYDSDGNPSYPNVNKADAVAKANQAANKANELVPTINSMSEGLQNYIASNQGMLDKLSEISNKISPDVQNMQTILADIQAPSGNNLASQLKTAADTYQKDYDLYKTAEQKAEESTKNYNQALVELASRDALIDALNTGALFAVSVDENGGYVLNNGLTLAADGRFYEGDEQLFTNASGIDQKEIKFTDYKGDMVAFGEDAGRNLTRTDVEQIFKRDYGFVPDQVTLNQFVGQDYSTNRDEFKSVVEQEINSQYNNILGRDATADEIKAAMSPSGDSVVNAQNRAASSVGIPADMPFASQDEKINFTKTFLSNQQQADAASEAARASLRTNIASELVANLREQGYSDDDIKALNQSGQFNKYLEDYVSAYDQNVENLQEAANQAYLQFGENSNEYLTARRNVLDAMASSGGYGVTKREDGSYLTKNFGEIDATTLQPKFVPTTNYTDVQSGKTFIDPATGIQRIEILGTSTSGLPESPYVGLFGIGQSAKPPEQGGQVLFGGGSGSVGGQNPLKEYFSGLNLVAVDDKSGADLYKTGDGKALLLYADGKGLTVDPVTKEPIWLTPEQIAQVKTDIQASNQAPSDVINKAKTDAQNAIDAGYITAQEAGNYLAEKGFLNVEEADIAKATGMIGGYKTPEEKLGAMVGEYYDPMYTSLQEAVAEYQKQGLGAPVGPDVAQVVGKFSPEQVAEAVKTNLPTAQYHALQAKMAQQAANEKQADLLAKGINLLAGSTAPAVADEAAKFKKPFITSSAKQEEFESPLEKFMEKVETGDYSAQPYSTTPTESQIKTEVAENTEEGEFMPNYFTYGQPADIDQLFSPFGTAGTSFFGLDQMIAKTGGLATPLMARGGSTRYGRYAGGGLPLVAHSGKARVDFREGDAVTDPGDGQSDDIPAMLADGEFVIPADVVAALGNGSTKAGSDKLYDMMHSIRAHHRAASPKDLPPPAKANPLDYLRGKKSAKAARR